MRVENTPEDVTDFPLAITSSGIYDEVHSFLPPSCPLTAPCSWIKSKSWKLTNQNDKTQRRNSNELDRWLHQFLSEMLTRNHLLSMFKSPRKKRLSHSTSMTARAWCIANMRLVVSFKIVDTFGVNPDWLPFGSGHMSSLWGSLWDVLAPSSQLLLMLCLIGNLQQVSSPSPSSPCLLLLTNSSHLHIVKELIAEDRWAAAFFSYQFMSIFFVLVAAGLCYLQPLAVG